MIAISMLLLISVLLSMSAVSDAFIGKPPARHNLARYLQQKASRTAAATTITIDEEVSTLPTARDSQILEFIEPTTGTRVVLIGSMHYNPHSIALTSRTIEKLGREGTLGSVIVESCETRWTKSQDLQTQESPYSGFLRVRCK
jgi:hypothetical protein